MLKRRELLICILLLLACPFVAQPAWAATWRLVGPYGGHVHELERCAARPAVVYTQIYSGGLYRSNDGGLTWRSAHGDLPPVDFFDLAVDPLNPDSAWVIDGSGLGGLYHTENGGAHWSALSVPEGSNVVAVAPGNGKVVYVGGQDGIFRSVDAGHSWQHLTGGLGVDAVALSIAIDFVNPSLMYAVIRGQASGVFVSTDGGLSWRRPSSRPQLVYVLRTDPHQSGVVVGLTPTGLLRSTDAGRTWRPTGPGNLSPFTPRGFAFGPGRPSDVYLVVTTVPTSVHQINGKSGRVVRLPADPGEHLSAQAISADLQRSGGVLIGESDGVRRTVDAGATWSDGSHGLAGQYAGPIGVRGLTSFLVGNQHSEDGGAHWKQFLPDDEVQDLAVNPADRNIVYAATRPANPESTPVPIWKSTDGGSTWQPASNGLDGIESCASLAVDARHPGTLYAATDIDLGGALFRSTNAGASWQPLDQFALHVELGAGEPGCLYTATGDTIQRSCDAGQTWATLLESFSLEDVAVAPSDARWIYAAEVSQYPDSPSLLWRSRDGGLTFDSSPLPCEPFAQVSLESDPRDPEVVYLAATNVNSTPGGVWRRRGDGPWEDLAQGLPNRNVPALRYDARLQPRLFASTGAGVWILPLAAEP